MTVSGATTECPECGSSRIYRSRLRSVLERLRHAVTEKQPYRCHECNHRGWYPIDVPFANAPDDTPEQLRTAADSRPVSAEDLDRLDTR